MLSASSALSSQQNLLTNGSAAATNGATLRPALSDGRDNSHMFTLQSLPADPSGGSTDSACQRRRESPGAPNPQEPQRTNSTHARLAGRGTGQRGFTIIELVIGMVVVAILSALAFPAFFDAIRKGRRSDAFAALTGVQLAQERWRANSASYTTKLADDLKLKTTSPNGHYTLSVTEATVSSYTLQATATGTQAQDKACSTMSLQVSAGDVKYGSACSTCTPASPPTDPGRCWSR